ncbi:MAG TPA: hypothetical protein PK874_04075 [Desulfobacteraceae bacterium]|nr:hypothetical protein [Desulfobacteraceae bacterium]HPJ66988.1 hypothetical protein [Desulfobacteraceae bacterium]
MINIEMNKEEADILIGVIERYLYHLQVEIIHTDTREFKEALKKREGFLKDMIDRFKAKVGEES